MAADLKKRFLAPLMLFAILAAGDGCKDMGVNPPVAQPVPQAPVVRDTVSFSRDIRPIFVDPRIGCLGCHGGTNNLFVGTQADLLRGGLHGPAIVPGNSAASVLVQKIGPNPPFGARMPFGGTPLPDSTIQRIKNWIDQGALNN
jgi:hypothetical protein